MLPLLYALALTAATAKGKAPVGIDTDRWLTSDDYAKRDLDARVHGATRYELTIDRQGLPTTCQTIYSSGYPALDKKSCILLLRNAHYKPALDEMGAPIASRVTGIVNWVRLPDQRSLSLWLTSNLVVKAPEMARSEARRVDVRIVVDEHGQVESCTPDNPRRAGDYGARACAEAIKHLPASAAERRLLVETIAFAGEPAGPALASPAGPVIRRQDLQTGP